jgi:hypothetical protein
MADADLFDVETIGGVIQGEPVPRGVNVDSDMFFMDPEAVVNRTKQAGGGRVRRTRRARSRNTFKLNLRTSIRLRSRTRSRSRSHSRTRSHRRY